MSAADPTIAEREMRYKEAQAKRGMKACRVWVPADRVEELKQIAAQMREGLRSSKDLEG